MNAVAIVSAALELWVQARETVDPSIRKEWDLLFLQDYKWLREKIGIAGENLSNLAHSLEEGKITS